VPADQPTKSVDKFVKNLTAISGQAAWAVACDKLMTNQAAKYQIKSDTCDVKPGFQRGFARFANGPVRSGAFVFSKPQSDPH
jgi:hypothetical protein